MRSSLSRFPLLLFAGILGLVALVIQFELIRVAFERLGLSAGSASLLLMTSLLGSALNIPLFRVQAERPTQEYPGLRWWRLVEPHRQEFTGTTLVALNVGGCVVPVIFSLYLLATAPLPPMDTLLAVGGVALMSHLFSRSIAGIGIVMPVLLAPFAAALLSLLLNPDYSAPLAYVAGTLGVLIGADLMRLPNVPGLGAPVAAIGGAGTFDGIFLAGVVAVLLA